MNDFRRQVPGLNQQVHGHDLVYFDNGATTHMPRCVAEAVLETMTMHHGNVRRGTHQQATQWHPTVQ